jgi:hypothetical protein
MRRYPATLRLRRIVFLYKKLAIFREMLVGHKNTPGRVFCRGFLWRGIKAEVYQIKITRQMMRGYVYSRHDKRGA